VRFKNQQYLTLPNRDRERKDPCPIDPITLAAEGKMHGTQGIGSKEGGKRQKLVMVNTGDFLFETKIEKALQGDFQLSS